MQEISTGLNNLGTFLGTTLLLVDLCQMTDKEIENYIIKLQRDVSDLNNLDNAVSSNEVNSNNKNLLWFIDRIKFIVKSACDYLLLIFRIKFSKTFVVNKRIVFTVKNFCTDVNGVLEDRIVKPLFTTDIIFINHSKEYALDKINNIKVYNVGGVVKLIGKFLYINNTITMKNFLSYRLVNDSIIRNMNGNELYTLCYYDLNGLSLVLSNSRSKIKLIEVQHGSIINYPPYVKPAPIKIAEIFYVKNQATIEYLKAHLCSKYPSEYRLIPYPTTNRKLVRGLYILYASTVEFNGLHPVFKAFLSENTIEDLHVIVRLHPRELEKEGLFAEQINEYNVKYEFDRSKNWLEGNAMQNIVIVSPWSSIIEEAYDNNITSIIIDKVGQDRYKHIIDNTKCFYSDDIKKTIAKVWYGYNKNIL